jgi:macrolide-specific efflux system membrane fusion protein
MKKNRTVILWCMVLSLSIFSSCKQNETTTPIRKNIEDAVFASGYIEQANQFTVSSSVEGILQSIPVSEGDKITKDAMVAVIKSDVQDNQVADAMAVYNDALNSASENASQLQQIQTKINQAREQLALDKANYERYKDLRVKNSVSQLDFEKAELQYNASQNNLLVLQNNYKEAASDLKLNEKRSLVQVNTQKAMLDDYRLTTSISGSVINVFKKQGELIRKGEAVAEIGSGAFIIKLFVAEDDIKKVNLEQAVAVHLNTNPDKVFNAKISKIYPSFNTTEQSYVVEAQFDQLPEKIFSGSQLQANIETGSSKNVLVIPSSYMLRESYVLLNGGEERKVVAGRKNIDWTEVISGITEQDIIEKPKK